MSTHQRSEPVSDAGFTRPTLSGRRWELISVTESQIRALSAMAPISDRNARILARRGVAAESVQGHLKPRLRDSLADPFSLLDMDRAVDAVVEALVGGRKITVFADYDVDGATSAAQIVRFCRELGVAVDVYVPDRLKEGYGPSVPAMKTLAARGTELLITVDCGAVAHEPLVFARDAGMEVVVLDHHLASGVLPPARAIVNPNRDGCPSGLGHLAAAGVTFFFLVALRMRLRGHDYMQGREEPDLLALLGLVALGTHCDMVPLTGVNRAFVAQGLKSLNAGAEPAVDALCRVAGYSDEITAQSMGFVIGPRINAGGRLGQADLGARMLISTDESEIAAIAEQLDHYNRQRRDVENAVLEEAVLQAGSQSGQQIIVASGDDWHPGVVGIVASRLKERFQKPAIAIGIDKISGIAKGSGRSIGSFNLGQAISSAKEAGLLISGGGHAMAAGLAMDPDKLQHFCAYIEREAYRFGDAVPDPLLIDEIVSVASLDRRLVEDLAQLAPFGMKSPTPLLAVINARIGPCMPVGDNHLRVTLDGDGGARVQAMAFRSAGTELGNFLMQAGGNAHVALTAEKGRGRFIDLIIEDVMPLR